MMVTGTAILVLPPEPRVPPSSVHRPNSPTRDTFEKRKKLPGRERGQKLSQQPTYCVCWWAIKLHQGLRRQHIPHFESLLCRFHRKNKGARWQLRAETIMERRFLLSLRVPCVPFASHCPRSLTNSSCLYIERHSNHTKIQQLLENRKREGQPMVVCRCRFGQQKYTLLSLTTCSHSAKIPHP